MGSYSEGLPRSHSEKFGWLDKSNWKEIENPTNLKRVDPALREIVQLLNSKGYKTYSSCSGGHSSDYRRRRPHMEGYIAFSPPTRAAVDLYFTLRERTEHFQLSAQVGILEEDNSVDQTVFSELRWQLLDERRHQTEYYRQLFDDLKRAIERLPPSRRSEGDGFLRSFFGAHNLERGRRLLHRQQKRFR